MEKYNHKKIEEKWRQQWEKDALYTTSDQESDKENFYLLTEFPYPSGNLHTGHWYAFAVPDIYARFMRMRGKNVLFPMGFDAFGLPAENAAIKRGINPREWTFKNMEDMRAQLKSMGASFDWSREVVTCDPNYYKWTQWMFTKMYEKGLAYQKETQVNWCPSCKTVLANEQIQSGMCERCDTEVEKREMLQWNLKITDYAERLLEDLELLDWPEEIKTAQRNWIGRSEGAIIQFKIQNSKFKIEVFTTRPDTLFGATYLVLSPEHPIMRIWLSDSHILKNGSDVEEYINKAKKKTDMERTAEGKEKTGVMLEGVVAINPATKEEIPVFIADYVLANVGTGAIMAVPAHDERDWEFAKKYNLPIVPVIEPLIKKEEGPDAVRKESSFVERGAIVCVVRHWAEDKYLGVKWGDKGWQGFITGGADDDPINAGLEEIKEETGYVNAEFAEDIGGIVHSQFFQAAKGENRFAHFRAMIFQLKDGEQIETAEEEQALHEFIWLSPEEMDSWVTHADMRIVWDRVRGRGCYTGKGIVANSRNFSGLPSEDAQQKITEFVGGEMKTTYKLRDWVVSRQRYWGVPIPIIHCKKCGTVPVPKKDLPLELPEIDDYLPTGDGRSPLAKARDWVEVACPKCGGAAERETDTLDTFVDSSWYFLRYTDPHNGEQFAEESRQKDWMPINLYSGGAEHTTMHLLYSRFWHKALSDMELVAEKEPYAKRMNRGLILGPDGNKMSKSKGNVIDPDEYVERLGADTVRMYLAFIGPYNETGQYPWNPDGIVGVRRFLEKVKAMSAEFAEPESAKLEAVLHQTIKRVGEGIDTMKMNTGVSQLMIFINEVGKRCCTKKQWEVFIRLLAPFAPHLAEEVWRTVLGHSDSVHTQPWPEYDESKIQGEEATLAVQVNGKVRGEIKMSVEAVQEDIEKQASEAVTNWLEGKEIKRVVYVPKRLVNFVVQ